MKILSSILLSSLVLFATPVQADDACCESPMSKIEQKLNEIDVTILLKQYEEIQSIRAKAKVALMLLQTEASTEDSEKQMSLLHSRIDRLGAFASELRQEILKTGKTIAAVTH